MSAESLADPGRRWRRCVRVGAVLCTLATVVPFRDMEIALCVWGRLSYVINNLNRQEHVGLSFFCGLIFTVLLNGPVLLLCASAAYNSQRVRRNITRVLLGCLWVISTLPPYYAANLIFNLADLSETQVTLLVSGLSVFLLISALSFLASRSVWYTPLYPFAMGTVPVVLNVIAWTGALIALQSMMISDPDFLQFMLVFGCGTVGSALMLLGWLLWWRAVRAAVRAKPETDPVVEAPNPNG